MNDDRKIGKLCFLRNNIQEKIDVFWNIFEGSFEKNFWKASISFSEDYVVPEIAYKILFQTIDNEDSILFLEIDMDNKYQCVIHNITDLSDSGIVEIASPNFGRVKSTVVNTD